MTLCLLNSSITRRPHLATRAGKFVVSTIFLVGDNTISASYLYYGTYIQFMATLPKLRINGINDPEK
ncbi:putative O-acetylhomoserine -lyase protein [Rhizophagus irregularis DAOM 181602=DAOM 197198]|nr:putative O-acetylhomoserine -lyase protein [Rhizophagus irregularis DAOM 181602=DAOM 197198]